MKEKLVMVYLEFADHIKKIDVNKTLEKLKSEILKINVYPIGKIKRADDKEYGVHMDNHMLVFDFIDESEDRFRVKYSQVLYIKGTIDGKIKTLGGLTLHEAYGTINIKSIKKTNKVKGHIEGNLISLCKVVDIRYTPKQKCVEIS